MKLTWARFARRVPGYYDSSIIDSGLGTYTKDYSNLPERYIKKKMTKIKYKSPIGPEYIPRLQTVNVNYHSLDRPWSSQYWAKNPATQPKETAVVEPILEENWMWFRGDRVEILTGPDKGKQGYINMIVQERNWVTVEGLNVDYTTVGGSSDFPGMMIKEEKPLLVTRDIKLVDPSDDKATEVEWAFTEVNERVRVSVRSGSIIPLPGKAEETVDYKSRSGYVANKTKDTAPALVEDITYEPKLATFEMDIMEDMGIKESRIPRKSWWY